jgi:hypothetical protein
VALSQARRGSPAGREPDGLDLGDHLAASTSKPDRHFKALGADPGQGWCSVHLLPIEAITIHSKCLIGSLRPL